MVTKILDHLYLGDLVDALTFKGEIICVIQEIPNAEPSNAYWIPIIRTKGELNDDHLIDNQDVEVTALPHQIEMVIDMLHRNRYSDTDTLVHCMAGIERSPLVIASYLHKYNNMTWDEAYEFIKEKRPEVQNRLQWLNLSYEDHMS